MTRDEAIERGLVRYLPDKPCRVGHISERYTTTGNCLECIKATRKRITQGRTAKALGWPNVTTQVPLERVPLLNACASLLRAHGPAADAMRARLAVGVDELMKMGAIATVECVKIGPGFRSPASTQDQEAGDGHP